MVLHMKWEGSYDLRRGDSRRVAGWEEMVIRLRRNPTGGSETLLRARDIDGHAKEFEMSNCAYGR